MPWWENEFLRVKNNKLYLEETEASSIAEKKGTPLFVYSRKQILANIRNLKQALAPLSDKTIKIHYAMKANPHPAILSLAKRESLGIDAVSPAEIKRAKESSFPASKIIFTGTSLSREDLHQALLHDGLIITLDAIEQLEMLKEVRNLEFPKKEVKLSFRWNPGIGKGFNSKVITAGERTPDGIPIKFGLDDSLLFEAFQTAQNYGFQTVGLHQHLGSGWMEEDYSSVCEGVSRLVEKASLLEKKGYHLEFLDFGGGFGPRYSKDQTLFPLEKYALFISRQIKEKKLRLKILVFEPGKYLVGNAGILLVKVEYVKKNFGNLFACVNTGTFNSVPRPVIYEGARHEIANCSQVKTDKEEKITVAGNLCETGDIFAREILLPLPKPGDILALLTTGAYCRSMASTFNLREIPREIFI